MHLVERTPQWARDAIILFIAVTHLAVVIRLDNQPAATFAIVGVAALALRRQAPTAVFVVTLPAAAMVTEKVASMLAVYAIARHGRRSWVSGVAGAALFLAFVYSARAEFRQSWFIGIDGSYVFGMNEYQTVVLRDGLYFLLISIVPAIFGYLVRTQSQLSERLREITEAREHEQRLLTQQALAAERAQLAREMHDVVSHQVSLIAVQAGALRLQAKDPETKSVASTIRGLSVRTLEELRHMVRVLRASGIKATELTPQPTIGQLSELVGNSGVDATLEVGPLPDLEPAAQRAIYRTVQEALTNARKHAPGSRARVRLSTVDEQVEVEVVNSRAERPVVDLPSSQHGLMGLRQRAELLGASLDYGPNGDGGWRLVLRLPPPVTTAAR